MADITPQNPPQDPPLRALNRLVGNWAITGDATGSVSYQWLDGGYFLMQSGDLHLFGHHNRFIEIVGRERPFGGQQSLEIKARTYTSEGDTLDYIYELNGDTLIIWGGHRGSESRYTGLFSADGTTLDGDWSWPGGGYHTLSTRQPAEDATLDSP